MILYRTQARFQSGHVLEWFGTLNDAKVCARELVPLSLDTVYIDKVIMPGREAVSYGMNHSQDDRTQMPGEQVKAYPGEGSGYVTTVEDILS